ncbi:MAG: threonine/serine exporter family protein [Lachnospiraceae bacterium]|nr:threonine/serine exporter family protein [Lachnospiraceae bacterium]
MIDVMEWIKLIVFSGTASLGFGMLFRIEKKYLPLACLGGAFTRFVYLVMEVLAPECFIYNFFAAMAAAAYAEYVAARTNNPTSVFLYPTIIPLIPVVQLYYSILGLIQQDVEMVGTYGVDCIHSLAGVGLGFIIISLCVVYMARYRGRKRRQAVKKAAAK